MVKHEHINAGFRLSADLVEWLDQYAAYLSESGGFQVSRTQALIRLISLSRGTETEKMISYQQAKKQNMSPDDYKYFKEGYTKLLLVASSQSKGDEVFDLIFRGQDHAATRELAIRIGKEELRKSESEKVKELVEILKNDQKTAE